MLIPGFQTCLQLVSLFSKFRCLVLGETVAAFFALWTKFCETTTRTCRATAAVAARGSADTWTTRFLGTGTMLPSMIGQLGIGIPRCWNNKRGREVQKSYFQDYKYIFYTVHCLSYLIAVLHLLSSQFTKSFSLIM